MLEPALRSAPIEVTIIGDIDPDRAIEVVSETLGAMADRDSDWPVNSENASLTFPAANTDPEVIRFNGLPNQGMANIYYPTGDGSDPARRRAMTLLREVYDLKAVDVFREREGATYSAVVSGFFPEVYKDFGYLWIGLDVDISDVDRMYDVANEIAETMASGEISEDELQRARLPVLERLEEQRQSNDSWVAVVARSQSEPERLDSLRQAEDHYRAVTVESLVALSDEVLDPDQAFKISILPNVQAEAE
jgi:zinc protease